MKKIQKFDEFLNELSGNVYKSVMSKVADKSDPRSFRLYNDAKRLRSEYYSKTPLKIQLGDNIIDFKITHIMLTESKLDLKISGDAQSLYFNINDKELSFYGEDTISGKKFNGERVYVDRRGANVISKILKDYEIEVRPQDIPQF